MRKINWCEPHHNELVFDGHITVAQKIEDNTWSWEVFGEDNDGHPTLDDALRAARSMARSIQGEPNETD
jgi:hypothetical protein